MLIFLYYAVCLNIYYMLTIFLYIPQPNFAQCCFAHTTAHTLSALHSSYSPYFICHLSFISFILYTFSFSTSMPDIVSCKFIFSCHLIVMKSISLHVILYVAVCVTNKIWIRSTKHNNANSLQLWNGLMNF